MAEEAPASAGVSISPEQYSEIMRQLQRLHELESRERDMDALLAEQSGTVLTTRPVPAAAPRNVDDLNSGRTYSDTDAVTVLHGWGRVEPERRDYKQGKSKRFYEAVGGCVKNVQYADAKYWQEQWGSKFVKILPPDATEADYARVTGIQPMNLSKLVAMIEAVEPDKLLAAWGTERSLRYMERLSKLIAEKSGNTGEQRIPTA